MSQTRDQSADNQDSIADEHSVSSTQLVWDDGSPEEAADGTDGVDTLKHERKITHFLYQDTYKEETGLVVPVDVDTEEGPELDHRVDRAHHCTVEAWQISAALQ
jgi:hypothetical protein